MLGIDRLSNLWARLTREPRYVQQDRVSESQRTLAGAVMNPDEAVKISAVWASLRFLSQSVAVCPWHAMREEAAGPEIAKTHPIDWLLWKRPNPEWSSFQFRETLTHWALRWGNGIAEIERDAIGRPVALWPIHPERVNICRDEAGALYYEINNGTNGKVELEPADVFHIRGFGEGPVGVNVVTYAAQSLGWARAAQLFGAAFFGNGLHTTDVIETKGKFSPEGAKRLKAEIRAATRGPGRWHEPIVLDGGAELKQRNITPEEAQFIATNQHLIEEVCRWFGVPPHKIAHMLHATFSNIEHQAIEVVVDSVSPWVKRFEDEADYKLFGKNRQGFYTKINMNALLRGDTAARLAWYRGMREIGVYSANDILKREDEQTIGEDGDLRTMNGTYKSLEMIGKEADMPLPAPALPAPEPEPEDDPEETDAMNRVERMYAERVHA